jgi:membrane protein EpsK
MQENNKRIAKNTIEDALGKKAILEMCPMQAGDVKTTYADTAVLGKFEVKNKKQQTRNNFYTNILTLIINVAVGIYYTPYLVQQLGIVAYGVVPLALIINQYISVVTGSLTSAFSRFYSVSVQQKKYDEASENISTALAVVLSIIIILTPFLFFIVYRIDAVFNIPVQLVSSAKYLFLFTIISFFFSLFTSLLNVTLYALNRLDWMNFIKICRNVLKLGLVICLFSFVRIDIVYVGLANLLTEFVILGISVWLFVKFSDKNIHIRLSKWNKTAFYSIGAMAIWIIIHQLGDTGIYRIDNVIVNKFWGLSESGALGVITELGTYVLLIVSVLGSVFGPLILIAYSKNDHKEVQNLAINQSYIVGALSAIIAGVVAGYSVSILHFWLGESFTKYENWLSVKMLSIPFFAAGGVLAYVYRTWNKVKMPALLTLMLGVGNVASVLLLLLVAKSIILILVICVLFALLQSYFLNAYCVNKIYRGTFKILLFSALKIILVFILSYSICKIIEHFVTVNNLLVFILLLLGSSLLLFSIIYFCFFNKELRTQLLNIIR